MKYSKHINYSIIVLFYVLLASGCVDILIGDKGELEEDIYLNYQTKTELQLPFNNEWHIVNGGRTHSMGMHHFITWHLGQKYAFDSVIHKDGKSYSGSGTKNEDYYCFGEPLYAPAAGKILGVENNIEDNIPGELNDVSAAGNYVMIDHLNGEYSLLAHFKKGTIIVAVGDTVMAGQELGKTGNSGNSTEAHLHYHLQNSPELLNSIGLPAQFKNYYADGVFLKKGEPIKGQIISR